jgi:hypothetical protein
MDTEEPSAACAATIGARLSQPQPCYELCQAKSKRNLFFLKRFFSFFGLPFQLDSRFEAFSWHRQRRQPLLYLLSVHGPEQGRHQLTCPVTAKKRARPISGTGRCQPKGWNGRAPFQIFSIHLLLG